MKDGIGVVLLIVIMGVVAIALFAVWMGDAPDKETMRLNAQTNLVREQGALEAQRHAHKETMFMLYTTSLAAFAASSHGTLLLVLTAIGGAFLVFYLAKNLIDAAFDRWTQC